MIRFPGKAAFALVQAASAAFVVSPREGCAQTRPDDREQSLAALGAAIAEAQRSPFHHAGPTDSGTAPPTARVTAMPMPAGELRIVLRKTGRHPAAGDVSMAKVFLATAVAAHLSDIAGLYLFFRGLGSDGHGPALSGLAVAALGPAVAAAALGRPFGTALVGSLLGNAVGFIPVAAIGEYGLPPAVTFSMYALVHAGTTTLATARW